MANEVDIVHLTTEGVLAQIISHAAHLRMCCNPEKCDEWHSLDSALWLLGYEKVDRDG